MVFPIHEQGLKIHTPKNQLLQRPAIRQTQATTASRRLVDEESGNTEHEQNISDQTWLGRQLSGQHDKDSQDQPSRQRALDAYAAVESSHANQLPHLPASSLMRSPVFTLPGSASISDGWIKCQDESIHHLVLVDDQGRLEGVIYDRDLLVEAAGVGQLVNQKDTKLSDLQLRQLIKAPLITAREATDVRDIARMMLTNKVRAVPVVDAKGQLLGIITRSDLMLGLVNQSIEINT